MEVRWHTHPINIIIVTRCFMRQRHDDNKYLFIQSVGNRYFEEIVGQRTSDIIGMYYCSIDRTAPARTVIVFVLRVFL